MKVFSGYVIGVDNKKMYSIILDSEEDKTYQMDCELDYIKDREEVQAERKFNLSISEEGEMVFEFLDERINEHITVDDLKNNLGIELSEEELESRNKEVDEYIAKIDKENE